MNEVVHYPLTFKPVFKERIWGGRRLETVLHKKLPADTPIGESWEITDYESDSSVVADGPLRGESLRTLVGRFPAPLLGSTAPGTTHAPIRFPLLVKWIDAREALSLQVHPADGHRHLKPGERGKSECWYIAHASPDSHVYLGVRRGVDRATLQRELARGTVAECFHRIPVKAGDFINVPAGVPHAIGGEILLAEVQHTSDTTFRLFDWNRTDARTGRPRELQIAEALDCIDFNATPIGLVMPIHAHGTNQTQLTRLDQPPFFAVQWRRMTSSQRIDADRPTVAICVAGTMCAAAHGHRVPLERGDCALLPGGTSYECDVSEHVELLLAELPTRLP